MGAGWPAACACPVAAIRHEAVDSPVSEVKSMPWRLLLWLECLAKKAKGQSRGRGEAASRQTVGSVRLQCAGPARWSSHLLGEAHVELEEHGGAGTTVGH